MFEQDKPLRASAYNKLVDDSIQYRERMIGEHQDGHIHGAARFEKAFFSLRRAGPTSSDWMIEKADGLSVATYPTWDPSRNAVLVEVTFAKPFPSKLSYGVQVYYQSRYACPVLEYMRTASGFAVAVPFPSWGAPGTYTNEVVTGLVFGART